MSRSAVRVTTLFVSAKAGAAMQSVDRAEVVAGMGIEGDRYAKGIGVYSKVEPVKMRHATFISQQGIDTSNAWLHERQLPPFTPAQTRRNIVLDGIRADELNDLVGRTFSVGGVQFRGLELATPCHRPSRLLNREGIFEQAFDQRGGLRAEACGSGAIQPGDTLLVA